MPNEKRQYYKVSKKYRDHESNLKFLEILEKDPEMKYFIAFGIGMGVSWIKDVAGIKKELDAAPKKDPMKQAWDWYTKMIKAGTFVA